MTDATSLRRILRRPTETVESLESAALIVGAAVFLVTGGISLLVFWGRDLEIAGRGSLGDAAAIISAAAALVAFVLGRVLLAHDRNPKLLAEAGQGLEVPGATLHWFDLAALAVAHAVIALLGWIGISDLLENSFIGAVVYPIPGAVLAGVAGALTAYVCFLSSVRMTPMLLSLVLTVFLVVGALASMLSASDPMWWKENLSALGITNDISSLAFNLTLIIAGVIVTIIARYATATMPTGTALERKHRTLMRTGLVLIGLFLAAVGVFPVSDFLLIHNSVATGMTVVFAAIVVGLRWLMPSMPKVFVILGYVYIGVIVVLAVFFAIGYYNLTAVELVAAVLIFSWIIVFLRNSGVAEGASLSASAAALVSRAAP